MAIAHATDRAPITRAEYDALVRSGALDDARVELLYGRISSMSPQGEPHAYSVARLARMLIRALADDRALVRVQAPLGARDDSEPGPDIAVVAPGDYLHGHPQTAWLVIEVAESSLARDRSKARLYATASVPEYWIVNLADAVIEVYREPLADRYTSMTRHDRGAVLRPARLAEVEIRVADVLPARDA